MDPLWTATERGFNRPGAGTSRFCRPAEPLGRLAHLAEDPEPVEVPAVCGIRIVGAWDRQQDRLPSLARPSRPHKLWAARYAGAIAACLLFFVTGWIVSDVGRLQARVAPARSGAGDPSPWWSARVIASMAQAAAMPAPVSPVVMLCRGVVRNSCRPNSGWMKRCLCCTAGPADLGRPAVFAVGGRGNDADSTPFRGSVIMSLSSTTLLPMASPVRLPIAPRAARMIAAVIWAGLSLPVLAADDQAADTDRAMQFIELSVNATDLFNQAKYPEALQAFDQLLRDYGDLDEDGFLAVSLADCLQAVGRRDEARTMYARCSSPSRNGRRHPPPPLGHDLPGSGRKALDDLRRPRRYDRGRQRDQCATGRACKSAPSPCLGEAITVFSRSGRFPQAMSQPTRRLVAARPTCSPSCRDFGSLVIGWRNLVA